MLVLSRRKKQKIMIGKDIEITILSVAEGKVRIGIVAPKKVPVHREEVYHKLEQERAYGQSAKQERSQDASTNRSTGTDRAD